jgi:hypothetical protein
LVSSKLQLHLWFDLVGGMNIFSNLCKINDFYPFQKFLVIGQALASHKEGVTTVEVKIVRIVIAQKQVNVQTVKDNIKFLRQTVLYSRNSKTKDKSTESSQFEHLLVFVQLLSAQSSLPQL